MFQSQCCASGGDIGGAVGRGRELLSSESFVFTSNGDPVSISETNEHGNENRGFR